jgi:hypothetical protein
VKLAHLTCARCAAAVSADPDQWALTCPHCGARLEVHRDTGVVYATVAENADQLRELAADAEHILAATRAQKLLFDLTAEWVRERRDLLWKWTAVKEPRFAPYGIVLVVVSVFALISAVSGDSTLTGVGFAVAGVVWVKACLEVLWLLQYWLGRRRYQARRLELWRAIEAEQRMGGLGDAAREVEPRRGPR